MSRPALPSRQPATSNRQGQLLRASLAQADNSSLQVVFSYPPDKLKLSTTAKSNPKPSTTNPGTSGTSQPQQVNSEVVAWGELALTVDPLYLIGTGRVVINYARTLLKWTNSGTELPVLTFGIGSDAANSYQVTLKTVTINVERYDTSGSPIRASVSLTMLVLPVWLEGTNPSSRGEAGSSVRRMIDGESVCRVAELTYGHPRYWRDIAEANELDDPLKARAGQAIYLPPPARVVGELR